MKKCGSGKYILPYNEVTNMDYVYIITTCKTVYEINGIVYILSLPPSTTTSFFVTDPGYMLLKVRGWLFTVNY